MSRTDVPRRPRAANSAVAAAMTRAFVSLPLTARAGAAIQTSV
jgi:hypothetical protein